MSILGLTTGYKPKDPQAKPYARGEFVCNVDALKIVEITDGLRYFLRVSIINAVKPKETNEAVMSDEINLWFNPNDEKSAKKFRDNMFVSGLDQFLDWSSDEALEASFPNVTNKLVYVNAWTFTSKTDGGEIQQSVLKNKSLITPENSQVKI